MINCTPGPAHDQLNAMAAALLSVSHSSATQSTQSASGQNAVVPGRPLTPICAAMTTQLAPSLVDNVNIFDYASNTLSEQSSSGNGERY